MMEISYIHFTYCNTESIIHEINVVSYLRKKGMKYGIQTMEQNHKKKLPDGRQMSERFRNSIFLALSGGFQDAYTYQARQKVFSNAQTGNVVLFSQHFMAGEFMQAVRYLMPLLAFALGVFVTEQIQSNYKYSKKLHWRQMILLVEILLLFIVGFLPHSLDMLASVLVSFTCAMQVQAFRKVRGYAYASTMCIGNLRSATAALSGFTREHDPELAKRSIAYFGVILVFAIGAGIGGLFTIRYGIHMIWFSCLFLMISVLLMFFNEK